MFKARSGPGEHDEDPDEIFVVRIHEDSGRDWLQIAWGGDGFDDAWILADESDTVSLGDSV